MPVGVRELKNNLSRHLRRLRQGDRVAITAHGRVVAELVAPSTAGRGRRSDRYAELVEQGIVRPPLEAGDPLEGLPKLRLPPGTAARWIDEDRGED